VQKKTAQESGFGSTLSAQRHKMNGCRQRSDEKQQH
jgi:hypothetical protein